MLSDDRIIYVVSMALEARMLARNWHPSIICGFTIHGLTDQGGINERGCMQVLHATGLKHTLGFGWARLLFRQRSLQHSNYLTII